MDERIKPYLPDYVSLYYVDYRDDLSNCLKEVQQCIERNEYFPLSEMIYDFWDYPEGDYIRQIEADMENDNIEGWPQIIEDNLDEIREYLWEKDSSTPMDDLLRNTDDIAMFYSLSEIDCGYHCGDWMFAVPYQNESYKMGLYKACQKLGIKKDSPDYERLQQVVEQSNGGELRIYWEGDIERMINQDNEHDFQSIHFKGSFLIGVINSWEGSGDCDWFDIDLELPFVRGNVFVSKVERYGLEEIFGQRMTRGSDEPILSLNKPKTRKKLALSENALRLATDRKYDEVFKAGGCTYGDTDLRRHRDTYYDNNIPCGIHCPHCGQFWID